MMSENKPEYNEKKAVEAAALLLQKAGGTRKHKWVLKMLYLIERESFDRYERPVIYDNLCSMEKGQMVSTTYDVVRGRSAIFGDIWEKHIGMNWRWHLFLRDVPGMEKNLSVAEKEIIEDVFETFGHMSADELGKITHNLPEYNDPGTSSMPTNYRELLAHLGYNQSDVKRILEELRQEALLDTILGG